VAAMNDLEFKPQRINDSKIIYSSDNEIM